MSEIIKTFRNGDISINCRIESDTIWLSQKDIAELFEVNVPAISKHLQNIYATNELSRVSTVSKKEIVQNEGNRIIKRFIEHYNLDVIIAVGYRVNSLMATKFRQFATQVLKEVLVTGHYQVSLKSDLIKISEAVILAQKLIAEQTQLIHELQPKADYFDKAMKYNGLTSFRVTAKLLNCGEKELIALFLTKYGYRQGERGILLPYKEFCDPNNINRLFEVKEGYISKNYLEYQTNDRAYTQTLFTLKGRLKFQQILVQKKERGTELNDGMLHQYINK